MGKIKKTKFERGTEIKREATLSLQATSQKDLLTAIVLTALTLMVYAFTAAPGVTLADSGDFINGVLTLGIVHPPGYPLYTVLGHLFTYLPFGELAYRVNLFSALWGALCLGVVFLILRILSIERIHAVFACVFLGFTTVFWSKTGAAEAYSLNGFLIACVVLSILSYNRDKKKSQFYLIFLTTGLALSNHYPLVILSGLGLVFLLDRRGLRGGDFLKGLLFLGLGLTPYLYLFIQATNPELQYNFAKSSDFGMVLDHIARKHYALDYSGTVWDQFLAALTFLKTVTANFLLASVFLLFGIGFSFYDKWKYRYPFLIAALSPSLGLILILKLTSAEEHWALFLEYLIPAYLFLSVFLAIGLKRLMNRYVTNKVVQVSLLVILWLSQAGFNFPSSSHHNDRLAEIWGTELLESVKPNSILILCGPGDFAIYYLQLIKGLREDVTLYDRFSNWTKDNLYGPELLFTRRNATEYRKKRERQLINDSLRPVYYNCKDALDEQHFNFSLTPFTFRADQKHLEASDFTQFTVSNHLLDSLANGYPKSNHWNHRLKRVIFSHLTSYYGGHDRPEVSRILDSLKKTDLYSDPRFILSLANNLYYFNNYDLARMLYERAEELSLQALSPSDLTLYCNILADARSYDKALGICIRQENSLPPCEGRNVKTKQTIAGIYKEQSNWPKVAEYSRKILECQPEHKLAQRYLKLATQKSK